MDEGSGEIRIFRPIRFGIRLDKSPPVLKKDENKSIGQNSPSLSH